MTIKENILKEKLIEVENNKYLLKNDEKYFSLGLEMMENIGALDTELRDNLIYGTLSNWILNNRFTFEQLENLLNIGVDMSHLFYKLYEKDEDAVFKRTFSVLVVAVIISKHRKKTFLSEKSLHEVKEWLQ